MISSTNFYLKICLHNYNQVNSDNRKLKAESTETLLENRKNYGT